MKLPTLVRVSIRCLLLPLAFVGACSNDSESVDMARFVGPFVGTESSEFDGSIAQVDDWATAIEEGWVAENLPASCEATTAYWFGESNFDDSWNPESCEFEAPPGASAPSGLLILGYRDEVPTDPDDDRAEGVPPGTTATAAVRPPPNTALFGASDGWDYRVRRVGVATQGVVTAEEFLTSPRQRLSSGCDDSLVVQKAEALDYQGPVPGCLPGTLVSAEWLEAERASFTFVDNYGELYRNRWVLLCMQPEGGEGCDMAGFESGSFVDADEGEFSCATPVNCRARSFGVDGQPYDLVLTVRDGLLTEEELQRILEFRTFDG